MGSGREGVGTWSLVLCRGLSSQDTSQALSQARVCKHGFQLLVEVGVAPGAAQTEGGWVFAGHGARDWHTPSARSSSIQDPAVSLAPGMASGLAFGDDIELFPPLQPPLGLAGPLTCRDPSCGHSSAALPAWGQGEDGQTGGHHSGCPHYRTVKVVCH